MSFNGTDYSRFDTTRMAAMPDDAIDLEQLTFAWPGAPALLRIERLRVARGERVFLRGPSGSGKSTLLGLIGGVLAPATGSVRVLGRPLHEMSAAQRDRFRGEHVGFVFQMFNLIPYLSVRDNVLLALRFCPGTGRADSGGRTRGRKPQGCWRRSAWETRRARSGGDPTFDRPAATRGGGARVARTSGAGGSR